MNLRWTDAGRAALASAAHVGTAAVKLTHLALGDGRGPGGSADDARAALRNERHRAAIKGTVATRGRIAFRADFAPDAGYGITEAGVFGTAGNPRGAVTLLLYWSDGGSEAGKAAAGTALAIAAVVEFQSAAAEVAVTVGGNIVFGATDPATEAAFGYTRYATGAETGAGESADRAVTPKGLHAAAGKVLASLLPGGADDGAIYQLRGTAGGRLVVQPRTSDAAASRAIRGNAAAIAALAGRVGTVEGRTGDATTASKGIVELATSAEGKTGTDAKRAMTPKAVRDSTAANIAALLGAAPAANAKYVLEGTAGGGLRLVRSAFLIQEELVTVRTATYRGDTVGGDFALWLGESGAGTALQLAKGDWIVGCWVKGAKPATGTRPVSRHSYTTLGGWAPGMTSSARIEVRIGIALSGAGSRVYPAELRGRLSGIRVPGGGTTLTPRLRPIYIRDRIYQTSSPQASMSQDEDDSLSVWTERTATLVTLAVPTTIGT